MLGQIEMDMTEQRLQAIVVHPLSCSHSLEQLNRSDNSYLVAKLGRI